MQLADKHERRTTKAFAGLRVLNFSTTIAGPHCARMLADMGAEVIKIQTGTTPGKSIAERGEHTRELREEIGLGNAASIPSGKTEAAS